MQMIHDAISPEQLEQARKLFEQEAKPAPEKVAADLDEKIGRIREAEAELAERAAFARRQEENAK